MRFKAILMTLVLGSLAACGGGSSSGNNNNVGNVGSNRGPELAITTDNAEEIAAEVIQSIDLASTIGGDGFSFAGAIGAVVEGDGASVTSVALDMADAAKNQVMEARNLGAVGAVIEEVQDCPVGGSLTSQINTGSLSETEFVAELEAGAIPAGTSVSLTFNDCADGEQPTVNGGVTIVFQQFVLDGELGVDPFTMEFDVTFDDLETDGQRLDGDISLLLISDAGATEIQVSGTSLEVTEGINTVAMFDFSISITEDNVETVVSINYTLDASELGGEVTIATQAPLVTDLAAANPRSGRLTITGASGSSVTLIALDAVNLQLDVDESGDGASELTIITTWAELEAAAA